VKAILSARRDFEVCCEASDGGEALEGVLKYKPDVAILDVSMPAMSGLAVAESIAAMNLNTLVLLFTMHYSQVLLREAKKAGVFGFVAKTNAAQQLIRAIDTLVSGNTFFCDDATASTHQNAGRRPLLL
jgi:DNA-binding NarL/FixJ family response regulator